MKRIAIADEQPLVRSALRALLETEGHLVVAEFDNGTDALQQSLRLEPDLLILDLALPRLGGLEVIRQLRARDSTVATLILTAQDTEHFAGLCLQAGSSGFVGKQEPVEELRVAIGSVLHGRSHFPIRALNTVAPKLLSKSEAEQFRSLSPRELTVLRYFANGHSNKEIADELALSDRTVSTYKTRLMQKLNTDSLAGLLEIAWRNGLLQNLPASIDGVEPQSIDARSKMFLDAFDAMPIPVCLRDREGRIVTCNQNFLAFYDTTLERAVGTRISDASAINPADALHLHQTYQDAVLHEQPFQRELQLKFRDRLLSLRYWGEPYHDEDGQLLGMICSTLDITDQNREIATLREAKEQLEALRHTRALYLEHSGEGFREALGLIELGLKELGETPRASAARQAARQLQESIEVLLDVVQLENRRLVLKPCPANLARLTVEELDNLRVQQPRLTLELIGESGPSGAWVDPQRYRQIIHDLCTHCADLGALQLLLHARAEQPSPGVLHWQLRIENASPQAQPDSYRHFTGIADYPLSKPHIARCIRLARLMDGELRLENLESPAQLAVLDLRLPASVRA